MTRVTILLGAAALAFGFSPARAEQFDSTYTRRIVHPDPLHFGGASAYADASFDGFVFLEAGASEDVPAPLPSTVAASNGEAAAGVVRMATGLEFGSIYGVHATLTRLHADIEGDAFAALEAEVSAVLMRCDGEQCVEAQPPQTARTPVGCSRPACDVDQVDVAVRLPVTSDVTFAVLSAGLVGRAAASGRTHSIVSAYGTVASIELGGWRPAMTGAFGLTLLREGNCFPGPGPNSCKITPVARRVYAFTPPVYYDEMGGSNYYRTLRQPAASTTSDATGYFELPLQPGEYSIFVEDSEVSKELGTPHVDATGFPYCNAFVSEGERFKACYEPAKEGFADRFDLVINHALD